MKEDKRDLFIRGVKNEWVEIIKERAKDDEMSMSAKLRKIIKDYVEEKQTK